MAEVNMNLEESMMTQIVGMGRPTKGGGGGPPGTGGGGGGPGVPGSGRRGRGGGPPGSIRNPGGVPRKMSPAEPLPLEEAAKRELLSMPAKTPVSVLQELLSRRGTSPKYELVQVEGAIHEPTFRYTVSVGGDLAPGMTRFAAMGTGRSKKEAKHAAAKAILDKITGNESGDLNSPNGLPENIGTSSGGGSTAGTGGLSLEERSMGNPIGMLQELCMTRRWPPPNYTTESEEGLPHERQFTISCQVFKHKEIGTGKSKKIAKRLAAHKMWSRLKDLPCENNSAVFGLDDDDELSSSRLPEADLEGLKSSKVPLPNSQYNMKVSMFHKTLKGANGPKIDELQEMVLKKDPDFNAVRFLQEVADEQRFEVSFVGIEEKSVSGKYQSLVQLSTLPVGVCYGTGSTSDEAQMAAAFNALQYLKILTSKGSASKH